MIQLLSQALMIHSVYLHHKFECSTNRVIILSLKNLINLSAHSRTVSAQLYTRRIYIVVGHRKAPVMENVQVTGSSGP